MRVKILNISINSIIPLNENFLRYFDLLQIMFHSEILVFRLSHKEMPFFIDYPKILRQAHAKSLYMEANVRSENFEDQILEWIFGATGKKGMYFQGCDLTIKIMEKIFEVC